jgi:hypothetical protein
MMNKVLCQHPYDMITAAAAAAAAAAQEMHRKKSPI